MLLDAGVRKSFETFRLSVLRDGVTLQPVIKKGHPGHEQALEAVAFCKRVFDGMLISLDETLYDMSDAMAFGYRSAEQIYMLDGNDLVLRYIKVKPRRSLAFVIDVYNNVCGMLGLVPGQGAPILVEGMIGAPDQIPNILPRAKFAVLTYRKKNNDPRGQSILRSAYNAWNVKQALYPHLVKFLAQFATPMMIGVTGETAQPQNLVGPDGNDILDSNGNVITIYPEQQMVQALQHLEGGWLACLPHGSEVNFLEVRSEGQAFYSAFQFLNKEIEGAITGQNLATSEGEHNARAASEVHQDVYGIGVSYGRTCIENMLRNDVLKPLMRYNFGIEREALTPLVSLTQTEPQDKPAIWGGLAQLYTAGYLVPSQLQQIDAEAGLPVRTDEEVGQAVEMAGVALETAKNPPEKEPVGAGVK
jgi:Protein of unknown function (DUF935)